MLNPRPNDATNKPVVAGSARNLSPSSGFWNIALGIGYIPIINPRGIAIASAITYPSKFRDMVYPILPIRL